jgi:hypothetical protein
MKPMPQQPTTPDFTSLRTGLAGKSHPGLLASGINKQIGRLNRDALLEAEKKKVEHVIDLIGTILQSETTQLKVAITARTACNLSALIPHLEAAVNVLTDRLDQCFVDAIVIYKETYRKELDQIRLLAEERLVDDDQHANMEHGAQMRFIENLEKAIARVAHAKDLAAHLFEGALSTVTP